MHIYTHTPLLMYIKSMHVRVYVYTYLASPPGIDRVGVPGSRIDPGRGLV